MGAKCFCGCGRTIPLRNLGLRSHNNCGHAVVKQLNWLRGPDVAALYPHEEREWVREGEEIVDVLTRAAHAGCAPPTRWELVAARRAGFAIDA